MQIKNAWNFWKPLVLKNNMTHSSIDDAFIASIGNVFPGASLLVQFKNKIIFEKTYGFVTSETPDKKITPESLFDIASLTKPFVAVLFMRAGDQKLVNIKDSLASFFPEKKWQKITLMHLLNHSSGLPAWKPFYKNFNPTQKINRKENKEKYLTLLAAIPLLYPPEKKIIYSDLGYMLLGFVLEKVYQKNLDDIFLEQIAKPLNLKNTSFSPNPSQCVPTEKCSWRKQLIQGVVMDENAWALGGAAGHAGLFSTAKDILTFLDALDNKNDLTKKYLEVPKTRDLSLPFFTLGFDTPSKNSSSGKYFSSISVGHLGYSGCSFWWDPIQNLKIILLTNRVCPTRQNENIKIFRPMIHNLIWETLIST